MLCIPFFGTIEHSLLSDGVAYHLLLVRTPFLRWRMCSRPRALSCKRSIASRFADADATWGSFRIVQNSGYETRKWFRMCCSRNLPSVALVENLLASSDKSFLEACLAVRSTASSNPSAALNWLCNQLDMSHQMLPTPCKY